MYKQNYEVDIMVYGKPVREYVDKKKTYIEGRQGTDFAIRIKNNGSKRILAVTSVDGLSVIDGKESNYDIDSQGYIISPYDSIIISGWRISDEKVKQFFFTNKENSYATRKNGVDNSENVGVIGVAIFREHSTKGNCINTFDTVPLNSLTYPANPWIYTNSNPHSIVADMIVNNSTTNNSITDNLTINNSTTNNTSKDMTFELGTGWGDEKNSEVQIVNIEKEDYPDAIFEIFYNSRTQLEKMGIYSKKPSYITPKAFPNNYCKPPK